MVPEGWKLSTLGEVCENNLQTGPFGSQLHASEYKAEGVPVLMPKDLNGFRADTSSAAKISVERARDLSKHQLSKGDILFSRRGDVTRFALIDESSAGALCGTGCLKATPGAQHSPEFLSYFLQKHWVRKWLEQNAVGQTMPNMNTAILSELPLMVAGSRQEEDTIAQILSTWDQAITATERLLENSQQRKKGLMQQLLTGKKRLPGFEGEWNQHALSEVAKVIVSPVDKKSDPEEKPVQLCNYTDVYYNTRITKDMPFMEATAKDSEIEKYTLQAGDVVITKDSETPGDIAVPALVAEDLSGVVCGYHLAILRASPSKLSGAFLNCLLSMPRTRYYFFSLATGATRFGLSVGAIHNAEVTLPSVPEQEAIANILTTCDDELEIISERLDRLKQEKKALMQQLLTGKRRVQVDTEAA